MTDSTSTLSYDVLVVGSDAAALVAALDCARIGLRVVVFATPAAKHRPTVFSHRGGIVASFLTELEIAYTVRESGPTSGSPAEGSIVGIPANPFAVNVRQSLGWRGAWRVYLDRVTPLLTIGAETNVGSIVRRRLGKAAVKTLVDPVLRELYGRTADEIPVAAVIPGLNQAMTRAGSLTTGIIELIMDDPRVAQTVEVAGGTRLIEAALRERLAFFSARIIDVTDVHLQVIEPASILATALPLAEPGDSEDASVISREEISVVAHATLLNPEHVMAPKSPPEGLIAEVGVTQNLPGLEAAVPQSRAASAAIRRILLSNPERLPLGPLDSEG